MPAKPPNEHGSKISQEDLPPLDSGESPDPLDDLDIVEEGFPAAYPRPEDEGLEIERPDHSLGNKNRKKKEDPIKPADPLII